jgi:hypothetical protein
MMPRETGVTGEKGGTRAEKWDRLTLVPTQEKVALYLATRVAMILHIINRA